MSAAEVGSRRQAFDPKVIAGLKAASKPVPVNHSPLFAPEPEGVAVQSDLTSSPQQAWRFGGSSRLLAAILKAARHFGEAHAFAPNGPALWARLRRSTEDMLEAFRREGAFGGTSGFERGHDVAELLRLVKVSPDAKA